MNKQFDSPAGAAAVREPDPGRLFSEIGFSATFFDSMPTEIVLINESAEVVAANDRFRQKFGDTLGSAWNDLLLNLPDQVEQNLKVAFNHGFHSFEVIYESSGESSPEFQIDAFRLHGNSPRAALIHRPAQHSQTGFWLPKGNSVTSSLMAVVERPDFYRKYETAKAALISIDSANNVRFANKAAEDLLGKGPHELTGRNIEGLFFETSDPFDTRSSTLQSGENLLKRPDGTSVWVDIQELPAFEDERLLILKDISEKKSEESELRSAFEPYRIFVKQSDHEVFRFDLPEPLQTGLYLDEAANLILQTAVLAKFVDSKDESGEVGTGKTRVGMTFGDFFGSPEISREVAKNFVSNDFSLFKKEILETSPEGRESYFNTNLVGVLEDGMLRRIWLSRRDITIRKQAEKAYVLAEDQLRQSQKIEPIGRLAGGIAHDFNNFLAVIMLQIEMMSQELDEGSSLRRRVGEIKIVADKAANMVKQLLAFGRKQTMQPHNVNLNEVVEEFIKLTGSLIGEDIEIELILEDDLGVCFVDPNQITQILMNLAINSKDAMSGGGKLRITTANLLIDENTFKHRAQPKGKYVELAVEDTGIGMDPATKKHVFEPFFTTKEGHKGTGLGLATVYGIVKQSKGFIWVDSKVGEGTRFKVHFPRIDKDSSVIKPERVTSIPRGNETILLVEDEELIRKTSVEVLSSLGYNILEARDGEEAELIMSGFEEDIHLLLTDVVMPKMNGRELAKKLKNCHPELSVLFMSGYADDIITRHGILEEDVFFLGKPFSPLTLAVKVREALGE